MVVLVDLHVDVRTAGVARRAECRGGGGRDVAVLRVGVHGLPRLVDEIIHQRDVIPGAGVQRDGQVITVLPVRRHGAADGVVVDAGDDVVDRGGQRLSEGEQAHAFRGVRTAVPSAGRVQHVHAVVRQEDNATASLDDRPLGDTSDISREGLDIGVVFMGRIPGCVRPDTGSGVEDAVPHEDDELVQRPWSDGYDAIVAAVVDCEQVQG